MVRNVPIKNENPTHQGLNHLCVFYQIKDTSQHLVKYSDLI